MEAGSLGAERILVVGAGSLGSVYGAYLALAGCEVQLLAREEHARAVQAQGGVLLETANGSALTRVRAEWRPDRIDSAEIVIVLTKTPDTEAALASLDHVKSEVRFAVSLQNGVEKDEVLARWCGADRVVGGISMVGGTLVVPGLVRHTFGSRTILGELPHGTSPRVERLAALLRAAGLEAVVSDDVRSVEWTKLVHAVPTMALTALTGLDFHAMLQDPDLAASFAALAREGAAVAAAAGACLDDATLSFPIGSIAAASGADAVELVRAQGRRMEEAGMTSVRVSMLQSIERGRRTEVEAIHGYVVREARRLGIPAPRIETCYRLLAAIDGKLA